MAPSQERQTRVMPASENVDEGRSVQSGDTQVLAADVSKRSTVVEHLTLYNLPYLQGDQEAVILHAIYELQFNFDNIHLFIVGRVLNQVDNFTHALIMRFPTVEDLQEYYKSDACMNLSALTKPYLHGEICFSYVTRAGYPNTSQGDPICATATILKKKSEIPPHKVELALHSLVAAANNSCFVKDFTAGPNISISNKFYTHGFTGFMKSVYDLDKLARDCHYSKVLHDKVLPLSSNTITVNILAFKPINSCL